MSQCRMLYGLAWCRLWSLLVAGTLAWFSGAVRAADEPSPAGVISDTYGVKGGLCVQLGGGVGSPAGDLATTGRFLVQWLVADPAVAGPLREALQAQGRYGLATVDGLPAPATLPLAENLANVVIVAEQPSPPIPLGEIARVLCPRGVLLTAGESFTEASFRDAGFDEVRSLTAGGGRWLAGRKRWPAAMDQWSHPRHAADGNAVSRDLLVGPPRRVRWVAGPSQEVSSVVSAQGRNYYGGVWTRDAFNGLRLWQRNLKPSPAQGGFGFSKTPGSVRPIAVGSLLLIGSEGQVLAIDGATGETVRTYPEAGPPSELLSVGDDTLLAVDGQSVRALEIESGRLRWKHEAAEPRYVVANEQSVFLLAGAARRGEKATAVALDIKTGTVRWQKDQEDWLPLVRRLVCHGDWLACEVSTLADEKKGNAIHLLSAADGRLCWTRSFVPHMTHMKQARAMFIGDLLWVLEDKQCLALSPQTGEVQHTWPAGLCHCFPPVATSRFMFSGEMELTDLATGHYDAQRITKAACGRDAGWMPANGLIYVTPKHCVCWPMLRGFVAMAPAVSPPVPAGSPNEVHVESGSAPLPEGPPVAAEDQPSSGPPGGSRPPTRQGAVVAAEDQPSSGPPGGSRPPARQGALVDADDWPCYRHDAWRSSGTAAAVPADPQVLWKTELGARPAGPIADDWRENPFVRGPVTPPVVAGPLAYVARPDAHEVLALDVQTGAVRWRSTANGRVDTAPTIHRGLCLFGTSSGWVYALRADDGRLVWRLRAAPHEERIVAYGQVESPWPVAGSVLAADGVVYFAAGRHSLADGGIRVFAVAPATGQVRWQKRLDTVPTKDFYGCNALEFDHIDLLHQEDDSVALSRWLFRRDTGELTCKAVDAFAIFRTDALGVAVSRGCWTYAPRHQPRHGGDQSPLRPLLAFRGHTVIGCRDDMRTLFRRDFNLAASEPFNTTWMTGWAAGEHLAKRNGEVWRSDRLGQNPQWSWTCPAEPANQQVAAVVWAGDQVVLAGSQGGLQLLSAEDGQPRAQLDLPAVVWDGLAVAGGRVFASTQDGRVICLGR